MRLEEQMFAQIHRVRVFENAPNLHVRQRKGLRQNLHSSSLDQFLFEDLSPIVCNRAIGSDGSSPDTHNVLALFDKCNLDVGILSPLFG